MCISQVECYGFNDKKQKDKNTFKDNDQLEYLIC